LPRKFSDGWRHQQTVPDLCLKLSFPGRRSPLKALLVPWGPEVDAVMSVEVEARPKLDVVKCKAAAVVGE
jgi:hypothetical protein